ncbi:SusC/RagA family TonB-linked outer membrane protein [Mucilaginibacter terrae]|uniref:TonB-linked SusC/RagA family outer membrane protein n=1 Tax=Mucilaginibacter terrae TaxID=1955052 RepID=A0ABU3GVA4_9SPHI|nr:TonB-dependent receptor [Mucilaginibacter terrae]MDT3403708.1 TonB-linked SusC/RagA family outer membrane protein [Mucilaginibacter terrae]
MFKYLFNLKGNRLLMLMLLTLSINVALAQETTVTGTVTDETGETVPGTAVSIKNKPGGTSTNVNGKFSIKASKGDVLVFKSLGYTDQEVAVGDSPVINVKFAKSNQQLTDVVVIGYGTQKRSNVSGAVASMKADKLEERPIARVDQALVGQLAGVTVKQTTGVPGKAFSVQVRGSGSISAGNEPLYVIDGFPLSVSAPGTNGSFSTGNPLDNINPNDIENIEVLKDAAAAAIYGSRASNGVVLITTKRGKTGKAQISYNAYAGFNAAAKKLEMLNGDQWIDRATEMINSAYVLRFGANGATANDTYEQRRAIINANLAGSNLQPGQFSTGYMVDPRWAQAGHPGLNSIDWQDVIERKGFVQNHQLSASGGTDNVKYFVSSNYADQNGFVKGLGYKAYSARANVEVNASKKLKAGINIAPTYSITKDPGVEGKDAIFHQALSMTPIQESTSGFYPNAFNNAQYSWSVTTNSPLAKLENIVGETKRFRTLTSVYAEYQIMKDLSIRSSLNLDNTDNNSRGYTPYTVTGNIAGRTYNPATNNNLYANSSASYSSYKRLTFVNENTINYSKTFNKVHSLNVLLGQSYNLDRLDQSAAASVGGLTSATIQTITNPANSSGSTSSQQNVLVSYFSRVQYSYKDKYLLSASLREDGSSRFGINTKYGVFPSASLAWRVTEENFMKSAPAVSDLKLRVSYGVNGSNNIPNYGSISTIALAGYVLGATPALANGQAPNVVANPDLQWEKSQTYDIGFDFGLFKNRITGSFDYYNKKNTQLLLQVPIPAVTGFTQYLSNAGSVRNIGQELEITSRNLVHNFQWNTSLNISHNSNKILSLFGNQQQIIIPNSFDVSDNILRVGSPINSIYVVKQIGFLTQEDINNKVAMYNNESVGDPKYQDLNGDGLITEADKQIVGHPNPNYTYGITNTFRYKGFDLSILVQGQTGGSIYSLLGRALTRTGQGFTDNAPAFYVNRWRSPQDQGDGRVSKAYSTFGFIANTDWLYSSDYIRVRNITLGYNLKDLFKASKTLQGARIYVSAENYFGHDKYYGGLNPEASNTAISSNSAYPQSGDYGGLPLAKSLIFGFNFAF